MIAHQGFLPRVFQASDGTTVVEQPSVPADVDRLFQVASSGADGQTCGLYPGSMVTESFLKHVSFMTFYALRKV